MVKYSDTQLDSVFSALSDPTRRAILQRLSEGSATVTELAEPFTISLPAISKHLSVLEHAGLIARQKDGRVHTLSMRSQPIRDAAAWLDRYHTFWNERFDALDRVLSKKTKT